MTITLTAETPWRLTILRWEYLVMQEGMQPVCYWTHSAGRIGVQSLEQAG